MSDNVVADPGTGGATFATDEIGGVHYPRSKVVWGPDGTANDADIANGKPLPVQVRTAAGAEVTLATETTLAAEAVLIGGVTETAPATDTASSGLNGRLQRLAQGLTALIALLPTSLGQKAKAASLAVTLASDQDALPITDNNGSLTVDGTVSLSGTATVSGTVTANAGTNLNTALLALEAGGNLAAIKADVDKIPSQGQALAGASMPVVLPAAQITTLTPPAAITGYATETTLAAEAVLVGAVTETAPGTDTASSGLNGRLQRIAQRLTSLLGVLPAALVSGRLDVHLGAAPATVTVTGTTTDGGAGKTLKTAVVALAASGNVVAAVSGKLIKVYAYELQSRNDTMTCQLQDDNGGNNVTIRWTLNAREGAMGSAVNPPAFLFKNSAQNKPIYATLTGTGTIDILVRYYDDDAS